MSTTPTSLGLTNVADNSQIIASAHRNNYSAIQTAVNSLITFLSGGLSSQVVVSGGGTTINYSYPPGYEVGYSQITSTVNVVSTTEASGTAIISPGALTFDGTAVIAEFFCPIANLPTAAAGNFLIVSLFEGATQITRLVAAQTPSVTAQEGVALYGRYRFTPTAASHTYSVTAFANSTTGTPAIIAGAAGTGAYPPAFVRFTKA